MKKKITMSVYLAIIILNMNKLPKFKAQRRNNNKKKKTQVSEEETEKAREMGSIRVPDVVPSPTQDSERLNKAFQGWGTDEKAIIWVLGHRNADQIKNIRETYQQLYNESLVDRLKAELSGDFMNAVRQWTMDPAERDAKLIKEVLKKKKKGVKELQVIVEISCSMPPPHLMAVRKAYCSLFDCSLEEDIYSSLGSSPLTKLLVRLVGSYRFDREFADGDLAKFEAAKLRESIEKKELDHEDVFWILSTRNFFQLKSTFECYRLEHGNPIDQDFENCSAGKLGDVLKLVVWCIDTPERHFAEVLKRSMEGLGTDEDSLTRVIVSRAETDIMKIRGEYFNVYKTSLDNAVVDDTSGHYQDFLMTLLGAKL